jgi:hypothetical protein
MEAPVAMMQMLVPTDAMGWNANLIGNATQVIAMTIWTWEKTPAASLTTAHPLFLVIMDVAMALHVTQAQIASL